MSWGCSYLTFHPSFANIHFKTISTVWNIFSKFCFTLNKLVMQQIKQRKIFMSIYLIFMVTKTSWVKKATIKIPICIQILAQRIHSIFPHFFHELFLQICFFWEVYKPNWISFTDLFDTQIPCCTASLLKIFIIRQFLSISYKKETFAFSVSTSPRKSFLNPFIH